MHFRFFWLLLAALSCILPAQAQPAYPARVVKIIVPFPPGGGSDLIPRLLAPKFQKETGQSLIIENKPSAGGIVAVESLKSSNPDGYTLMLATVVHLAQNPHIYPGHYDPLKDFEPVALLGTTANVLFVGANSPIKNLDDLLKLTQTREVTYGSSGAGTTAQLAVELLRQRTGAKLKHVPYKGGAAQMADVAAGHVELGTVSIPAAAPLIKGGKLRAIAVTGTKRDPMFPDVPRLSEKFPGLTSEGWYSVVAPAGTPKAVTARLHAIFTKIANTPETHQEWSANSIEPLSGSQAELAALIKSEFQRWGPIIKSAGIEKN